MELKIRNDRNDSFLKDVRKLEKRAKVIGVPFAVGHVGETVETHPKKPDEKIVYQNYIVTAGDLKFGDYRLVGTLDTTVSGSACLVHEVPGESVPVEYRSHNGSCDHCNKIRSRKMVCVLAHNETGKHVAIGRSCVKDYIGYDVNALLGFHENFSKAVEAWENDEFDSFGDGGSYSPAFDTVRVAAVATSLIRSEGYISRDTALDQEIMSTRDSVELFCFEPTFSNPEDFAEYKRWKEKVEPTEADVETAKAAIEWIKDQVADMSYTHNLQVIAQNEYVERRNFGYWVSLPNAYARAMEHQRQRQAETENTLNEHFGEIKKRYELELTVGRKCFRDSQWGGKYIVNLADDDGHQFVWFGTNQLAEEIKTGETIKVKATVKDHGEYKDIAQTVLTRVTAVERELEAA